MIRAAAAAIVCAGLVAAVTIGGKTPSRKPAAQVHAADAGYARALGDMRQHFWDARGGRIQPTQGDGGPQNGLVVKTQTATTFWQMSQYHKLLFGAWQIDHNAEVKSAIAANWHSVQATYTPLQLRGNGRDDHSVNISDDAGWKANYFAQVHSVTGDPEALHDLEEMLPAVTYRFLDRNQQRIANGKSPAGQPFYSNPHGILYAAEQDQQAYQTYGRVSTLYEVTIALAALYAYEQDSNPAYLSYAKATYAWVRADLRNIKESPEDAATGIYLTELTLTPANVQSGHLEAKNRYFLKPVRALSAEYSGGTLAMAVLAARLFRLTHDQSYLAEARSIVEAFGRLDAFGRERKGVRMFVNERDPWTEGYWYYEVVAEVLPLPYVDTAGTFRAALRGTAAAIVAQRTKDGYYGADWSGAELNTSNGVWTWLAEGRRANEGRGGGAASPEQIMTSANSALVVQAAHLLDHRPAGGKRPE